MSLIHRKRKVKHIVLSAAVFLHSVFRLITAHLAHVAGHLSISIHTCCCGNSSMIVCHSLSFVCSFIENLSKKLFKSKKSDCLYISALFYTEKVLYVDLLCKMPQRVGRSVRSVMHFKAGVLYAHQSHH